MIPYNEILNIPPFSLNASEKNALLNDRINGLTQFHYENCLEYRRILDMLGYDREAPRSVEQHPFLPVRLFKTMELKSVDISQVFKTMTSSGTTGQQVSKIYLDRQTASNQQKTLVKIVSDFIGPSRLPMLMIDHSSVIRDRAKFSARGAGILGFSIFGSDKEYALKEDMSIDVPKVISFLEKHAGKQILLFGFTFMIWQYFYKELLKLNIKLDLSHCVLIHGGGWKKLAAEAVSRETFKERLNEAAGIERIYDYYGMVEQTGCIYMECEKGHLHASIFSDVITRRHSDFSVCETVEPGLIQVISLLPESYPGHSLLTEDEGVILGEDDCPCGRLGKYFKVNGRIKGAELRGCSDTYGDERR